MNISYIEINIVVVFHGGGTRKYKKGKVSAELDAGFIV